MRQIRKVFIKLYERLIEGTLYHWLSDFSLSNKFLKFNFIEEPCFIERPFRITGEQYISIQKDFQSYKNLRLEAIKTDLTDPILSIGSHVHLNENVHIGCVNKIIIGDHVLIASHVFISDHTHGEINQEALETVPNKRKIFSKGPVIIGDKVWIGEGVSILSNVIIGKNCIIGSNSVVTKSFPENSVIAGNPAKIIKQLS